MNTFNFNPLDSVSFDEIFEHVKASYVYNYGADDFRNVERKFLDSNALKKALNNLATEYEKDYFTAKDLQFIANNAFFFAGRNKSMLVSFMAGRYWNDNYNKINQIISSEHMRQIGIQLYRLF